ncbi:MAG TPA: ABC transporter substrate-binding protein [Actinomycetota bacterium]|nr:ABC transporter substrate-binding protein [Actinomycetota bacterium]
MRKSRLLVIVSIVVLLFGNACAQDEGVEAGAKEGPKITVGSANFPESVILAEIYAQALEAEGYDVSTKLNIGAREVYFPALERGDIDVLPEYIGSLVSFMTEQKVTASPDSAKAYEQLTTELDKKEGLEALEYAEAQDKDGIVANKQTADEHNLKKVSDLKPIASQLVMGGPPECPTRQACLKGLKEVYGIELKEFKPLDVGGPQTVTLLKSNEIQLANLFTTDSRIAANGFVLLDDDKGIAGAENVLPIVRSELTEAYGAEFSDLLNSVTAKLTTAGLTELNKQVDVDKDDPDAVAEGWLQENGFL